MFWYKNYGTAIGTVWYNAMVLRLVWHGTELWYYSRMGLSSGGEGEERGGGKRALPGRQGTLVCGGWNYLVRRVQKRMRMAAVCARVAGAFGERRPPLPCIRPAPQAHCMAGKA